MEEIPDAPRDGRQQGSVACQNRRATAGRRWPRSRTIISPERLEFAGTHIDAPVFPVVT